MDIINFLIYMFIACIFNKIFRIALDKSNDKKSSYLKRNASRVLVILVFSISIISLLAYSYLNNEVGLVKRMVAGVLGLLSLIYLIRIIKRYIKE